MTPGATGWVGVTEIQLTGVFDFFLTVIFHFSIIRIWGLVLPSIVDNFFGVLIKTIKKYYIITQWTDL